MGGYGQEFGVVVGEFEDEEGHFDDGVDDGVVLEVEGAEDVFLEEGDAGGEGDLELERSEYFELHLLDFQQGEPAVGDFVEEVVERDVVDVLLLAGDEDAADAHQVQVLVLDPSGGLQQELVHQAHAPEVRPVVARLLVVPEHFQHPVHHLRSQLFTHLA